MAQTLTPGRTTSPTMPPPWQIGVAGVAAIGVTFGLARYGYGLFAPDLRAEFDLSVGMVGMIGSATYVGYLFALVAVGAWASRMGPRLMVVIGGASATVGMAVVASAGNSTVLVLGLVLAGTSTGWAWAPFSDAVDRMIEGPARERVMGLIPSGTAFGVAVAGPLALVWHGTTWRYAWWLFAGLALLATVYNAIILVGRDQTTKRHRTFPGVGWFLRKSAATHYLTAVSYGIVGAVYWTFAVSAISPDSTATTTAALFWTTMGVAGTLGVAAGVVIVRRGLRFTHLGVFGGMGVAVLLLAVAPGSVPAVVISALLYGPAFMAGSSVLAVWSYQLFSEHPATAFSVTLLAVGVGTVTGPAVLGALADQAGLGTAFAVTAAISGLTLMAAPAAVRRPRDSALSIADEEPASSRSAAPAPRPWCGRTVTSPARSRVEAQPPKTNGPGAAALGTKTAGRQGSPRLWRWCGTSD